MRSQRRDNRDREQAAMPSLTERLLTSAFHHLLASHELMKRTNHKVERGYLVEFDGALRIRMTMHATDKERIVVAIVPIRRKCSPNHIYAAKSFLSQALAAATKEIFGIRYNVENPTSP